MTHRLFYVSIILLSLLIVGFTLFSFSRESQMPTPTYSATVNRDCAPWDGSAFTVSIPVEGAVINISIYQSPEIHYPSTFFFPDETGKTGRSVYLGQSDLAEPLAGKVTFRRVESGNPVEGEFYMKTSHGKEFRGKFIAQWENKIVYCG